MNTKIGVSGSNGASYTYWDAATFSEGPVSVKYGKGRNWKFADAEAACGGYF